jgi:hypothetical protein
VWNECDADYDKEEINLPIVVLIPQLCSFCRLVFYHAPAALLSAALWTAAYCNRIFTGYFSVAALCVIVILSNVYDFVIVFTSVFCFFGFPLSLSLFYSYQ